MYKITLSLLLFLAFAGIDQSTLLAQSDNPIMVIRCRFDAEDFQENNKPTNQSKVESPCPEGYTPTEDGGCIPICPDGWTYKTDSGLCKCDEVATSTLKRGNSKVEESCSDFCFIPPTKIISKVIDESGPVCNPCLDDQLYLNGICYEPSDCFDGDVDINPIVDCNNVVDGNVPVTLSISGIGGDIPPGAFVSLSDIINCLSFDDDFVPFLTLAQESIVENTSENGMFSFGPANSTGIIEVSFYAAQGESVFIDLDNGQSFEIETCASDPCSCENPDNIRQGGAVVRFADVLTLTDLPEGVEVLLNANNNPEGFTDENGSAYAAADILGTVVGGEVEFDFYRGSSEPANITYTFPASAMDDTSITRTFISSTTCDVVDCPAIPTIGQWGLLILGLMTSCLAIGFMLVRKRDVV